MVFPQYTTNCPEGVYEKRIQMTSQTGYIRPGDLARQMEKITEEHLCTFGMGREKLRAEGKIWVIAWSAIHIQRLPKQGEALVLRLWPGKIKTMMYPRKYAFYTYEGECLICASSLFVLMDTETRGFASPSAREKNIPAVVLPGEPEPPRLNMHFPIQLPRTVTRIVQPREIDKNGHLNNTHYLDWADELCGAECGQQQTPGFIWIQYIKELLEGQAAVLQYDKREDSLYIRGYVGEKQICSIVMDFHH